MSIRIIFNKFAIVFTALLIIFSVGTIYAQSSNDLLQKADSELYKTIQNLESNELIDIYIWKNSICQKDYESELLKLGFDEKIYGNEDLFQFEVIDKLDNPSDKEVVREIRESYLNSPEYMSISCYWMEID